MTWTVEIGDEFEPEFHVLPEDVRMEILALSRLLQQFGPQLGRPRVDTLNGSRHANMKELRFGAAGGEWRVAFAFDTKRKAIMLVAGDKSGVSEKVFYRQLITKADKRFESHLNRLKEKELKEKESKQQALKKKERK
ncbi:MAG TPA: type II toxin-antitoxin system RelE/ParE family toxin [Terriglobales bacterium]